MYCIRPIKYLPQDDLYSVANPEEVLSNSHLSQNYIFFMGKFKKTRVELTKDHPP